MSTIKFSQLPYINSGYTDNDIIPFVSYINPTGTTSVTKINDLKNDVLSNVKNYYLPISGGTLTGATFFQDGLSANTISATTYLGLPNTLYTGDGILASNRVVTQNSNILTFVGGTMFINEKLQQGTNVFANGVSSHAEGRNTIANGNYSHAEGFSAITSNQYSHAEGRQTYAQADYSHAEGYQTITSGQFSHAEGRSGTTIGQGSHVEGFNNTAVNQYSHAEGRETQTSGDYSHAEGFQSATNAIYSHAEGYQTIANGAGSHTEGRQTQTSSNGRYSHAEGYLTNVSNDYAHAEGRETTANGTYSHAEGFQTTTNDDGAHAEGDRTTASGEFSHAEGRLTQSLGSYSHAEGDSTLAIGYASHAEGKSTTANGDYSLSIGQNTVTNNSYSFTQGLGTLSNRNHQFVLGRYNTTGNTTSLGVIGNGINDLNRSDLLTFETSVVNLNGVLNATTISATTYQNLPTLDSTPTSGSTNGVQSGGMFDVLALKANKPLVDTVSSSALTGITTEEILKSYLISANTLTDSEILNFANDLYTTGTAGICTSRLYTNTSNSLSGASILATTTSTIGDRKIPLRRQLVFKDGNVEVLNATSSVPDDNLNSSTVATIVAFNPTIDNWIITTGQNDNAGDSTIQNNLKIHY